MVNDGFVCHLKVFLDRPGTTVAADNLSIDKAVFSLGVEGQVFRLVFEFGEMEVLKRVDGGIHLMTQVYQAIIEFDQAFS